MKDYDNIHFGVDYYPEHWPEERWKEDARLMAEMGLGVVRMAEFSWHKMEPREGVFDFSWLDRAISLLGSYGIKTVLGTPTAAPPAWMVNKYPEILPVDSKGITHGFGGRHHDCQSNALYRERCRIIAGKMAERYADNENVIGWQIDNELGNSHSDFCHCSSCRKAFQDWLRKKYGNIDSLNKAWGTAFWSQEYNDFSEVYTTKVTAVGENPSQMLDWKCFHSDLINDFAKNQVDIIRKLAPNQFITHNYMGFSDLVDYYELGKQLDFVCHDQYPLGYWYPGGKCENYDLAAQLDVIRSFKKKPFWIMEQESGIAGSGSMGRLPKPGQIPMWALQSVAHGADAIVFFRWRTCTQGTEQYWHGILPHSGIPGRSYDEIKTMISKVTPVMKEIKGAMPNNKVGIIYSFKQNFAFQIQTQSVGFSYISQLLKYYKMFYDKNIPVDFIAENERLCGYELVVAPLLYLMNENMASKLSDYVENGGNLVLTLRSGVKDDNNICMSDAALPGLLSKVSGCKILEYDPLGSQKVEIEVGEKRCIGTRWADIVLPDGDTEVVARYASEFYKGEAAITRHKFGRGSCWYVGTEGDEELYELLLMDIKSNTKINSGFNKQADIEIVSREKSGVSYLFLINHSDKEVSYTEMGFGSAEELLYGERLGKLAPFEVHIIKKSK
ncbi:MAG: beta-galactosidase [Lachnospiraceae bacterium]|nr:beta-galactosidase [Lachnospiraceae bacterium]